MYDWYKSSISWIIIRSAVDFLKLANFDSTKGRFGGPGCQQHLPQNLGYTEDYQQMNIFSLVPYQHCFVQKV